METTTAAPGGGRRRDEPPQLRPADGVDAGGGLVEDEQVRLVQHRQRERQLLPHAAGEAAGEPAAGAGEPRAREELRDALVAGAPA